VTLEKLTRLGVRIVHDLVQFPLPALAAAVGESHARHLLDLANAHDDRPVVPDSEAKSVGNEETFHADVFDPVELRTHVVRLADSVLGRCRRDELAPRTITLKVKFPDFALVTRSKTLDQPITTVPAVMNVLDELLTKVDLTRGVRLVGVSVRNFAEVGGSQLSLFGDDSVRSLDDTWAPATKAIDQIRDKYGAGAIRVASALPDDPPPGSTKWGPQSSTGSD
jgi:DNA polymerase-4